MGQVNNILTKFTIAHLRNYFQILQGIQVHIPDLDDRVNRAPPRHIAIYEEHLWARLHFPLHPFIIKIFNLYHIIPAQLTQNTFQIICAFLILCHDLKTELKTSLFCNLFMIKRHPYGRGWWFIGPRQN